MKYNQGFEVGGAIYQFPGSGSGTKTIATVDQMGGSSFLAYDLTQHLTDSPSINNYSGLTTGIAAGLALGFRNFYIKKPTTYYGLGATGWGGVILDQLDYITLSGYWWFKCLAPVATLISQGRTYAGFDNSAVFNIHRSNVIKISDLRIDCNNQASTSALDVQIVDDLEMRVEMVNHNKISSPVSHFGKINRLILNNPRISNVLSSGSQGLYLGNTNTGWQINDCEIINPQITGTSWTSVVGQVKRLIVSGGYVTNSTGGPAFNMSVGLSADDTGYHYYKNVEMTGNAAHGWQSDDAAIEDIYTCHNVVLENCNISNNGYSGIYAASVEQLTVKNCHINDNAETGILLDNAANCVIENNQITPAINQMAVKIGHGLGKETKNNLIKNNVINGKNRAGTYGLGVAGSNNALKIVNNSLENNDITGCGHGIMIYNDLRGIAKLNLSDNYVHGNTTDIRVTDDVGAHTGTADITMYNNRGSTTFNIQSGKLDATRKWANEGF